MCVYVCVCVHTEAGDRLSSQGLMGVMDGVIAPLMPTLLPDSDTVERLLTHVTQQGGDNPPKALTDIVSNH